jgi:dTDP-4-dehydrorhamnose 3,5-epimerase
MANTIDTSTGISAGLAIPRCQPGIGTVISDPSARGLISGVVVSPLPVWPDDRGYFLEVGRIGRGLIAPFPPETTQISATSSYPGTIKAFHYHVHQTDCWVPTSGMLQVALVDLREGSDTFGEKNTIYTGMLRPWQIVIPAGVAHGYKVLGDRTSSLVYITSRVYDPSDELRIAYNDQRLNYDWETQHK